MTCPITGEAVATTTPDGPSWVRTDPEIHVAVELLDDEAAREAIEEIYTVSEECSHHPKTRHARLRSVKR